MVKRSISEKIQLYNVDEAIAIEFLSALIGIYEEKYPSWTDEQKTRFKECAHNYATSKNVGLVIPGVIIVKFKERLNLNG